MSRVYIDDFEDSGTYWDAATRYVAARISEISEAAWCASWEIGIEFRIWRIGEEGSSDGRLDEIECTALVNVARELNCWWVWYADAPNPCRLTLAEWNDLYKEYCEGNNKGNR